MYIRIYVHKVLHYILLVLQNFVFVFIYIYMYNYILIKEVCTQSVTFYSCGRMAPVCIIFP